MTDSIKEITKKIEAFSEARGWNKHNESAKDMAVSVVLEASELLEHFQWITDDKLEGHVADSKEEIRDEIADVAIYVFQMASQLDIDLAEAIESKMEKNAVKYPI